MSLHIYPIQFHRSYATFALCSLLFFSLSDRVIAQDSELILQTPGPAPADAGICTANQLLQDVSLSLTHTPQRLSSHLGHTQSRSLGPQHKGISQCSAHPRHQRLQQAETILCRPGAWRAQCLQLCTRPCATGMVLSSTRLQAFWGDRELSTVNKTLSPRATPCGTIPPLHLTPMALGNN